MSDAQINATRAREILLLFLNWPDRTRRLDDEPVKFLGWLKENYAELYVVQHICTVKSLSAFFSTNQEIIDACRELKPHQKANDVRRDRRISLLGQAFLFIFDCQQEVELIGTSMRGVLSDISEGGIGVETARSIPVGSVVQATLVPPGVPVSLYSLSAVVKWRHTADTCIKMGLSLLESEDYDLWKERVVARLFA